MEPVRLIIIDDHTLVRETWSFVLNQDRRIRVIATASAAEEGIELCKVHRPDVVMLDINLGGMSGMEALPLIRKFAPITRIIGVSLHTLPSYVKNMMQKGASGYVTKSSPLKEMATAIVQVAEGKKYICEEIKSIIAQNLLQGQDEPTDINCLSMREIEIVRFIKEGYSSKQIAEAVSISVKTVEVHRYNIYRKLKLRNAAALVNYVHHFDFV